MLEAVGSDQFTEARDGPGGLAELAKTMLSGDLLGAGSADEHFVRLVADRRAGGCGQTRIVGCPPEEGVRIEQNLHAPSSQAARSSSGSGSKKASLK